MVFIFVLIFSAHRVCTCVGCAFFHMCGLPVFFLCSSGLASFVLALSVCWRVSFANFRISPFCVPSVCDTCVVLFFTFCLLFLHCRCLALYVSLSLYFSRSVTPSSKYGSSCTPLNMWAKLRHMIRCIAFLCEGGQIRIRFSMSYFKRRKANKRGRKQIQCRLDAITPFEPKWLRRVMWITDPIKLMPQILRTPFDIIIPPLSIFVFNGIILIHAAYFDPVSGMLKIGYPKLWQGAFTTLPAPLFCTFFDMVYLSPDLLFHRKHTNFFEGTLNCIIERSRKKRVLNGRQF